jgi:hypothetical protein
MASPVFNPGLREFKASLADAEENLLFIESAAWLRPRLGELLNWGVLTPEVRIRCQSFMDKKDVQSDLLYRGVFVLIAGAFEQLVRRCLKDAVTEISKATPRYADLNAEIVRQNVMRTGRALATILDPPTHLDLDYPQLCTNIGTCIENSDSVSLNAEAFALFFSTLTPSKLAEVLRRIGVTLDWDAIGRDRAVRAVLGTTKTRQTADAVQRYLKNFINTRNKLAHSGSGGVSISPADVQKAIKFFRAFVDALTDAIHSQLF